MILSQKTPYILAVLLLVLIACGKNIEPEDVQYTEEDVSVTVGKDVEILYSDSAILRVQIQAPILLDHTDLRQPRQEFPSGIKVDFFSPTGQIRSTLTSKTAVRVFKDKTIIVRDSVVLHTKQNETLETEELTWNERSQKLTTDKFVKITRPGEVLYGFGLDANQDFSYWKIKAPTGKMKAKGL